MNAKKSKRLVYKGKRNNRIAFPMGGMGAGMLALEGTGALSHLSIFHRPDVYNEPPFFSALWIKAPEKFPTRVLEGPVPSWKIFGQPGTSNGGQGSTLGFPRFATSEFDARFPFGRVRLYQPGLPVRAEILGWSPFIPGDQDSASLPVAGLEYTFTNTSRHTVRAVYSFNARNNLTANGTPGTIIATPHGFVLTQTGAKENPWENGALCAETDHAGAKTDCAWFRGGWFDPLTMAWDAIETGRCVNRKPSVEGGPGPGATLSVPFILKPGQTVTIRLRLSWYVPCSNLRLGEKSDKKPAGDSHTRNGYRADEYYTPWYAGRFKDIGETATFWKNHYENLRRSTLTFSDCLYDSTLPAEVLDAVTANLTILKSPTVLRQKDGRLWCWEGCCDKSGCCHGSCTHVWNYAQALPHLFPVLERSLRETEFNECQDSVGHQNFRAPLPIRPAAHDFHAAADGQLGGIMKVFREWRISGDTTWLKTIWPKVRASLDYCISTWDPGLKGIIEEPHHNTYDIEFWGPDSLCTSFYIGALHAAAIMAEAAGNPEPRYTTLYNKGKSFLERRLFNGEYFYQRIRWKGLNAGDPAAVQMLPGTPPYSAEALRLLKKEGPKYQYGTGCLSDGILGAWMGVVCGMEPFLDPTRVKNHLKAVFAYNFKTDLSDHANPQRSAYALGKEGGLLLCTWPKGNRPSLPFVYSNEVWTGIEYQVAAHLIMTGNIRDGLSIVRAVRKRYDGHVRNPFNEYECGHWYGRALASYSLIQALTGFRYDAVTRRLTFRPAVRRAGIRTFFACASGFGTLSLKGRRLTITIKRGELIVSEFAGPFTKEPRRCEPVVIIRPDKAVTIFL